MSERHAQPVDPQGRPYDVVQTREVGEFDEKLMDRLEQHIYEEANALQKYQELSQTSPDDSVRYLAKMLLEDEQRHHRVLMEMLNWFRSSVTLNETEPAVPPMAHTHDATLRATVKQLRKQERHDLRELRVLRRKLAFLRRDSLLGVLVRSLELDTRKHLLYLEAMGRIAKRTAPATAKSTGNPELGTLAS